MLPRLGRAALELLFPSRCLGCGREGSLICTACSYKLPRISPPVCRLCGVPQAEGDLCPACLNRPHRIDGLRAPFRFEGVIRQAVYRLKYDNLRYMAATLAGLLGEYLADNPIPGDTLVPVPLHPRRLRQRGYNQSRLLADGLSKLTGLPVTEDCLRRQKPANPQAKAASIEQRRRNVADAFAANDNLKGKRIILIDDVATSGATLDAAAAALRSAGAASVWGLTVAREV